MAERRITIRYRPTGTIHFVGAAGGPEDGSLADFNTYCGRVIGSDDQWQEGDFDTAGLDMCELCLDQARRAAQ